MSALLAEKKAAYDVALGALKGKQRLFVEAYVGEAKCNGAEAARLAGYKTKPNVQAARMLAIASISTAVQAWFALKAMPADEVLLRVSAHAAADMGDFLTVTEGQETIGDDDDADEDDAPPRIRRWSLDLDKAQKAGKLHLIKEIKPTKFGTAIKLHDAQAALALLGKHHKLWGDDGGILKFIDLSKLSDAQLTRINQGEDPLAVLLDKQPDPA